MVFPLTFTEWMNEQMNDIDLWGLKIEYMWNTGICWMQWALVVLMTYKAVIIWPLTTPNAHFTFFLYVSYILVIVNSFQFLELTILVPHSTPLSLCISFSSGKTFSSFSSCGWLALILWDLTPDSLHIPQSWHLSCFIISLCISATRPCHSWGQRLCLTDFKSFKSLTHGGWKELLSEGIKSHWVWLLQEMLGRRLVDSSKWGHFG